MIIAKLLFSCLFFLPIHDHECRFPCLAHGCLHKRASVATWDVEFANDAELLAAAGIVYETETQRPVAPEVVILEAIPGSNQAGMELSSADVPGFWSVVSYQPLNVAVKVTANSLDLVDGTGVQLFLDGRPVHGVKPEIEFSSDGRNNPSFMFSFGCPTPGRHFLQARYLKDNLWSQLSPPLHFQIPFPTRPRIISVSDASVGDYGGPLTAEPIKISGGSMRLKLGQVRKRDRIIIYVDGKKVGEERVSDDGCCVTVNIANQLIPGRHDVTVRAIPGDTECSLASEHSEKVQIQYANHDVYLLRPGFGCDSGSGHCDSESKENEDNDILPIHTSKLDSGQFNQRYLLSEQSEKSSRESPFRLVGFQGNVPTQLVNQIQGSTQQVIDPTIQQAIKSADRYAKDVEYSAIQTRNTLDHIETLATMARKTASETEHLLQVAANHWLQARIAEQTSNEAIYHQKKAAAAFNLVSNANGSAQKNESEIGYQLQLARDYASEAEGAWASARDWQTKLAQYVAIQQVGNSTHAAKQIQQFATIALKKHNAILTSRTTVENILRRSILAKNHAQLETKQAENQAVSAQKHALASRNVTSEDLAKHRVTVAKNNALVAKSTAYNNALARRDELMAASANQFDIELPERESKDFEKRSFYFAAPAHFPLRQFGSQGKPIELEGAVIYEDMRFTFDENGQYEVEFKVSTPDLPTRLMMQFQVKSHADGPWFTLTMPMQRIESTEKVTFDPPGNEVPSSIMATQDRRKLIAFEGNSEILKRCFTGICDVRRSGSARFGFGIEGLGHPDPESLD